MLDESTQPVEDWWSFRGTEEEELKDHTDGWVITIAQNSQSTKRVYRVFGESEGIINDYIIVENGEYIFLFASNDETINTFENSMQKLKWYFCPAGQNVIDGVEYTGTCPISLSDFADSEIYSRSYLERLIENFNK